MRGAFDSCSPNEASVSLVATSSSLGGRCDDEEATGAETGAGAATDAAVAAVVALEGPGVDEDAEGAAEFDDSTAAEGGAGACSPVAVGVEAILTRPVATFAGVWVRVCGCACV